jgi:hypothetical protein
VVFDQLGFGFEWEWACLGLLALDNFFGALSLGAYKSRCACSLIIIQTSVLVLILDLHRSHRRHHLYRFLPA